MAMEMQQSTAVSACESPSGEKEKRSVVRYLVGALLKPCCGSSNAPPGVSQSKTKAKKINKVTNYSLAIILSIIYYYELLICIDSSKTVILARY